MRTGSDPRLSARSGALEQALAPRWVRLGYITRPHGVQGELKVHLDNPDSAALSFAPELWVEAPGGPRAYPILRFRAAPKQVLLMLEGISDRDQADALKGKEIYLREDLLPPLEEGEVYLYQLEGLRVETLEGEVLGVVEGTLEAGANTVLVVLGEKGEYLLPFIEDVVQEIDLGGKVIRVELLEGLEPS